MATEIQIDHDRCIACGSCKIVAPELFDVDEDGLVVLRNAHPDEALRGKAEAAAASCPALVITVRSI